MTWREHLRLFVLSQSPIGMMLLEYEWYLERQESLLRLYAAVERRRRQHSEKVPPEHLSKEIAD